METAIVSTTSSDSVQRLEELADSVENRLHGALADIDAAEDLVDGQFVPDDVLRLIEDAQYAIQAAYDEVVDWQQDITEGDDD
jgi:hypothetical protein